MKSVKYLFLCLLFSSSCFSGNDTKNPFKKIPLNKGVKIIIPVQEKDFNDSLTYSHIEIWIKSKKVYYDTSLTEYMFGEKLWPHSWKLDNGEYIVLMPIFDAPDFNKLWALYFRHGKLIQKQILPYFEDPPRDIDNDGQEEYVGIMNVTDAYENSDSCYYNPALYYEKTDAGIKLDSTLTIEMNKISWGNFYGFNSSSIVLPCPSR